MTHLSVTGMDSSRSLFLGILRAYECANAPPGLLAIWHCSGCFGFLLARFDLSQIPVPSTVSRLRPVRLAVHDTLPVVALDVCYGVQDTSTVDTFILRFLPKAAPKAKGK